MNRIDKKFSALKRLKKKAFIAFITAGYPSLKITRLLVKVLEECRVDIVELGVPFSDPLADGPVIQKASEESLKKGTNLYKILRLVRDLRRQTEIPLCLMSYYNPIYRFGEEKFLRQALHSGVDGLIIPDLPPEEAKNLFALSRRYNIHIIPFIAPTTSPMRIRYINRLARGFIYYVSLTGVTGARKKLPLDLIKNLRLVKRLTDKPVCVGFGISLPAHLKQVYQVADGAIVGSALVKIILQNASKRNLINKIKVYLDKLLKNVS